MQLFLLGEKGAVDIGDLLDDLVRHGFGGCFRPLDVIAKA